MPNGLHTAEGAAERHDRQPGAGFGPGAPLQPFLSDIARYWWVELVAGVLWVVIALVVLRFNHASVVTIGVLTGVMLLLFAAEEFALAALDRSMRWPWVIFGLALTASGIIALVHPAKTFAGLADILGFVFLLIGVLWMIRAFTERVFNPFWWLTLISGVLMIVLGFWADGQFFWQRAYTLLVFAGIWALMKGVTDIVRAFQIRSLGEL